MSLSFNSLRSIMTIHYLCLYSVFKVHRLMSNNRNGTRKSSICFVTCFALCFDKSFIAFKQAWRSLLFIKPHCSLLAWRWWDSNSWPPACKAGALPTELHPHTAFAASVSVLFSFCLRKLVSVLSIAHALDNGLEWTRTIDLTLIRRAL